MKIDYERDLIFWKRKAYSLSAIKTEIVKNYSECIEKFEIHKSIKNGEIQRKYAWDSVLYELNGEIPKIIVNVTELKLPIATKPKSIMPAQTNHKPATLVPVTSLSEEDKEVLRKHYEEKKKNLLAQLAEIDSKLEILYS